MSFLLCRPESGNNLVLTRPTPGKIYLGSFWLAVFCLFLASFQVKAQTAIVSGTLTAKTGGPLEYAAVSVIGQPIGTQTDLQGRFTLQVPAEKNITLQVKLLGYEDYSQNLLLKAGQNLRLNLVLTERTTYLNQVEVNQNRDRKVREQVSITKMNPREIRFLPSPTGDFNRILATLPGVVSNNELSSTYSVRGGNYDENLVYVDNIEIYRPNLVSNGQQEGLSFINPDMVADVEFSSGGWQPKYGDKLSSVLSIKYRRPQRFGGTATASLTGGSLQIEGTNKSKRLALNFGTRHRNSVYLFKFLPVKGNYRPRFTDLQGYVTYDLSPDTAGCPTGKTVLGLLASYAKNEYRVAPVSAVSRFGTVQRVLQVSIFFEGNDVVDYSTFQGGLNLKHQFNEKLRTEMILSGVQSREREFKDVEGYYAFSEVNADPGSTSYGETEFERSVGSTFDHSRNTLLARIAAAENRTYWNPSQNHEFQAGLRATFENLQDDLYEYSFTDSSDYVNLSRYLNSSNDLKSNRVSGYLQHSWRLDSLKTLSYGTRASYWTLNQQLVVSPRVQYSFRRANNNRFIYKIAAGVYHQPPFYREMRNQQGEVNRDLKAQQSFHSIIGVDYLFKFWGRDFKLRTEAYYKYLTNVVPYDVDNVRIRYYGKNMATAYAYGVDARINGEFIRGAESWFSLGYLNTKENVVGDTMTITRVQGDSLVTTEEARGYIRRPTDQRLTLGIFFQDHLPRNPSVKMYLNLILGTGLVTGIPGDLGTRNVFTFPFYRRVDIGFSKLLTFRDEDAEERRGVFQSIWLGVEVLNLIAAPNTISYNFVKDIDNRQYAVPNTLTGRLVNVRLVAKF